MQHSAREARRKSWVFAILERMEIPPPPRLNIIFAVRNDSRGGGVIFNQSDIYYIYEVFFYPGIKTIGIETNLKTQHFLVIIRGCYQLSHQNPFRVYFRVVTTSWNTNKTDNIGF